MKVVQSVEGRIMELQVQISEDILNKAEQLHINQSDILALIDENKANIEMAEINEPILIVGNFTLSLSKTNSTLVVDHIFGQKQVL